MTPENAHPEMEHSPIPIRDFIGIQQATESMESGTAEQAMGNRDLPRVNLTAMDEERDNDSNNSDAAGKSSPRQDEVQEQRLEDVEEQQPAKKEAKNGKKSPCSRKYIIGAVLLTVLLVVGVIAGVILSGGDSGSDENTSSAEKKEPIPNRLELDEAITSCM